MKTHAQHAPQTAQHAPQTAPATAPWPSIDDMLSAAMDAERSALAAVARARVRVAEAERVLQDERQILDRAHALARSAAETVRVLRERCAAQAQALAALQGQ